MRRILVTGAAGFIGSALVESLAKNNYEVWCTTRGEINLKTGSGNIKYINCDLTQLEESIGSFYAVINRKGASSSLFYFKPVRLIILEAPCAVRFLLFGFRTLRLGCR